MRIGILGSGVVAYAMATGWTRHGHDVRLGTRDPDARPELAEFRPGTFDAVAADGELVVLALRGTATEDVVRSVAGHLAGKVVIDATNPLDEAAGGPRLFTGSDDSLGERVQRAAPQARVVKAYNSVGNALMVDPQLPGGPPTMFLAGDDPTAKRQVAALLDETGWEPADLGDITASRQLEQLAVVWVTYGVATESWTHAFKMLH